MGEASFPGLWSRFGSAAWVEGGFPFFICQSPVRSLARKMFSFLSKSCEVIGKKKALLFCQSPVRSLARKSFFILSKSCEVIGKKNVFFFVKVLSGHWQEKSIAILLGMEKIVQNPCKMSLMMPLRKVNVFWTVSMSLNVFWLPTCLLTVTLV